MFIYRQSILDRYGVVFYQPVRTDNSINNIIPIRCVQIVSLFQNKCSEILKTNYYQVNTVLIRKNINRLPLKNL